jgi:hypothetical protein
MSSAIWIYFLAAGKPPEIRLSRTKQLEANPELKEAYRKLVKNLPAEQQERAMMLIAARTLRTITPRQQQSQGARV